MATAATTEEKIKERLGDRTFRSIGKELKVDQRLVSKVAAQVGVRHSRGPRAGNRSPLCKYQREELQQAIKDGVSLSEFARRKEVSRQSVHANAKRWGFLEEK